MRKAITFVFVALIMTSMTATLRAQDPKTVKGTLVDSSCYLGMNMTENDHGDMRVCGTACLKMGQPGGVVTSDGAFHAIIAPAAKLAPHAGHTVRITGMLKEGVIMATKAEMNVNGNYQEFDIKGMM